MWGATGRGGAIAGRMNVECVLMLQMLKLI